MARIHNATLTPSKTDLLAGWMGSQRWYAAKGAQPVLRRIAAWRLDDPDGEVGIETLVVLDEGGPTPVVYQVPLTYRGAPLEGAEHALVGTLEHSVLGRRWVYDGPHDPAYAAQLLALVQGRVGAASSSITDAVEESVTGQGHPRWPAELTVDGSRVLGGEQSNTSIVFDCRDSFGASVPVIAKVFRMLAPGDNPDVILQGALRAAGCARVPAVVGSIRATWPDPGTPDGPPASGHLVFVQEFLPGVEDAWRVALREIEAGSDFTEAARALGAATAEVHTRLAEVLGTAETTSDRAQTMVAAMRARFAAAVDAAPALTELRDACEAAYAAALGAPWPPMQRIHGDFHLGQVLRSPDRGWVLLDFEGEPLRPLAERSELDQWVRDVAGMLRSIDYVGGTWEQAGSGSARPWVAATQAAFLEGYATVAPTDPRSLGALLSAFELDKAMYEVVYEARNRPGWLGIPVAAVRRLTADCIPHHAQDRRST